MKSINGLKNEEDINLNIIDIYQLKRLGLDPELTHDSVSGDYSFKVVKSFDTLHLSFRLREKYSKINSILATLNSLANLIFFFERDTIFAILPITQ